MTTRAEYEREATQLLRDFDSLGWDKGHRIYAVKRVGDDLVSHLVHTFGEDPHAMLSIMLSTGNFKPHVEAVALAVELWRFPTLDEFKEATMEHLLPLIKFAFGDKTPTQEQIDEKVKEAWIQMVQSSSPSESPFKIETKMVKIVSRKGPEVLVNLDKGSDRVSTWESDEVVTINRSDEWLNTMMMKMLAPEEETDGNDP